MNQLVEASRGTRGKTAKTGQLSQFESDLFAE